MASLSPVKRTSRLTLSQSKANISPSKARRKQTDEAKIRAVEELLSTSAPVDEELLAGKSKERVGELMKGKLSESESVGELQTQLLVRDKYIELLKSKLIDLCVESKVLESESAGSRERMLQQQYKEKADLLRSLQTLEQENQRLLQLTQAGEGGTNSEKENLELLVDGLTEETEQLKGQLVAKDTVLANMKKDLEQLSSIIQEMTGLNKDLNEKIARMNGEMEVKNKEHYQAMAKAQHVEETEKELAEQVGMGQAMEEKIKKLTETTSRIQELEEAASEFRTSFSALESRLPSEFRPHTDSLKPLLARFQVGSLRKQPEATLLKDKAKQLELELRATNRDLTRVSANESALRTRLTTQEAEYEGMKKEMKGVIEQLNKTIGTLQGGLSGFTARNEKLAGELVTAKGEAQKAATKVINLQGKVEKATTAFAQAGKSEAKALLTLKDAQSQISSLKLLKTTTESTLLLREQKVKEDTAKLKVLTEELWKRDTLILKKSSEILKLEEQMNAFKAAASQSHNRPKVQISYDIGGSARNPDGQGVSKGGKSSKLKGKINPNRSFKGEKPLLKDPLSTVFESLSRALELKDALSSDQPPSEQQISAVLPNPHAEDDLKSQALSRVYSLIKEAETVLGELPGDETVSGTVLGLRVKSAIRLDGDDGIKVVELIRRLLDFGGELKT